MATKWIKGNKKVKELIDQLGSVDEDLKQLNTIKKDGEPTLRGFIDKKSLPQDDSAYLEGTHYRVRVGKVGEKREITDLKAIHEILGDEAFYALATFPLKHLDDYLTDTQKKKIVAKTRGGNRSLKYERFKKSSLNKDEDER